MSLIRAFVALPLDDAVRRTLADAVLHRSLPREGLRFVPRENLHLTLRFLGDVDLDRLPEIVAALREAIAGLRPFSCRLEALIALPSPRRARLIAARLSDEPALQQLAARVEDAAVRLGFEPEARRFLPHVTLARVRRPPLRDVVLPDALPALGVPVDGLTLFRSDPGPEGSRYQALASLPFATR